MNMTDVELYILKFNTAKQERLFKIRFIVQEKYPNANEWVYYGIPTVEENGKCILHYAAYKDHVSIIVGYALIDFLKDKYPEYRYTRASVIFPDKKPFPEDFIREICKMLG